MMVPVLIAALVLPCQDEAPVVAVDWHPRESKELRKQIDKAVTEYAEELRNGAYSVPGGRTLQALGLVAALPRLPPDKREKFLADARKVVGAEREDFWPGNKDRDATDGAAKLASQASYHLPLVLLLLEHEQAGALQIGSSAGGARDREMRFGILPAKPVRKDVVRLLALLLASKYATEGSPGKAFDEPLQKGKTWSYSSFGWHDSSCISPTGMAAIGLSAAVFGLNVLEYDKDDYEIKFGGHQLTRKQFLDRLTDVCAHLVFSLVLHNRHKDLAGMTADTTHLDAEAFREILAPGKGGELLVQIWAQRADLKLANGNLAVFNYQTTPRKGAYYSACAAYTLAAASRVLALVLEREAKNGAKTVGKHYKFEHQSAGTWKLSADGGWTVETAPESERRFCPLRFSQNKTTLDVHGTIVGALNVCVACATMPDGPEGRKLRGYKETTPQKWMQGGSSDEGHVGRFAALHAFSLHKAAVATGNGYAIGRWPLWKDLAEGLARKGFVQEQVKAASNPAEKSAALAFSIMTMTRTFRPIFPKSDPPSPSK